MNVPIIAMSTDDCLVMLARTGVSDWVVWPEIGRHER